MNAYQIGYYFYDQIFKKKELHAASRKKKVAGQRHQPSNNKRAEKKLVHLSIKNLGLLVSSLTSLSGSQQKDLNTFCKASVILCKSPSDNGCHGCGPLTCQHILVAGAMLGLFLNSFMGHAEIAPSTVSFEYICQKYGYERDSPTIAEEMRQLLDAVAEVIGQTPLVAENNGCEKVRSAKGTTRYYDTIFPCQRIIHYLPDENVLQVTSHEGCGKVGTLMKWKKGSKGSLPPRLDGYWDVKLDRRIPSKRNLSKTAPRTLRARRKLYDYPQPWSVLISIRKPFDLYRSAERCLGIYGSTTKLRDCFLVKELNSKEASNLGVRFSVGLSSHLLPENVIRSKIWFPPVKLNFLAGGVWKKVNSKIYFHRFADARKYCLLSATLFLNNHFTTQQFFPYCFDEKVDAKGGKKRGKKSGKGGRKRVRGKQNVKETKKSEGGKIPHHRFVTLYEGSTNNVRGQQRTPYAIVLEFEEDYVLAFVTDGGEIMEDNEFVYIEKAAIN